MARGIAWLTIVALVSGAASVEAETVGQVFRRVNDAVVIVRTQEREIAHQSGALPATVAA
jgi:hypothetical protein